MTKVFGQRSEPLRLDGRCFLDLVFEEILRVEYPESKNLNTGMLSFLEYLNGHLFLGRLQIWQDSRFQMTVSSLLIQTQRKASPFS